MNAIPPKAIQPKAPDLTQTVRRLIRLIEDVTIEPTESALEELHQVMLGIAVVSARELDYKLADLFKTFAGLEASATTRVEDLQKEADEAQDEGYRVGEAEGKAVGAAEVIAKLHRLLEAYDLATPSIAVSLAGADAPAVLPPGDVLANGIHTLIEEHEKK